MGLLTIIFIAFALAMDAFAVSIAEGIVVQHFRMRHALTIGTWFGVFQAVMPLLGWMTGSRVRNFVQEIDHWIAFGLLLFIGLKMIWEAFRMESIEKQTDPLNAFVLFALSVATSVDAFAAGISFAMLNLAIVTPIIIIGLITFCISVLGVWIGNKCGHCFEKPIAIAGGCMLVVIGVRILISGLKNC
ncbi:MAG: manganese efflux pump [Lentisphaerae bacterium]|nr:manganese efflux pump [Lentisphaerota bacterium]